MAKQPKLVLRESAVVDVTSAWPPATFLEMGCGTGHMTRAFLDRGFNGACYDLGADSRDMTRANLARYGSRIHVVDEPSNLSFGSFDYLLAFEVLEHIKKDQEALVDWSRYVAPGGRVIVSVPAHATKYGRSDELVGHVRRYGRTQLRDLLESAGYRDINIINYGFPITEVTRRLSNYLVRNDRSYDGMSAENRSIRSAQAKPRIISRWLTLFSGNLVWPFRIVQRWFYRADWGDGMIATGIKRGD